MAHKATMKRKNKITPCTDANQHVREHKVYLERKNRHEMNLEQKRREEYEERMKTMQEMQKAYEKSQKANEVPEEVAIEPSIVTADVANA